MLFTVACCLSVPIANEDSDVVIDKCDRLPLCFDFVLFLSLLLLLLFVEWGVAAAVDDSSAEITGVAAAAAVLTIRSNDDGVEERW